MSAPVVMRQFRAHNWVFGICGLGCLLAANLLPSGASQLPVLVIGISLLTLPIMRLLRGLLVKFSPSEFLSAQILNDPLPCLFADEDQVVFRANAAAFEQLDAKIGAKIADILANLGTAPDAMIFRLHTRATSYGQAMETVITGAGRTRIIVMKMRENCYLWRLDEGLEKSGGAGAELFMMPLLLASHDGLIVKSNQALRDLIGMRPKTLTDVFGHAPVQGGAISLNTENGPVLVYLAEAKGANELREIYVVPIPEPAQSDPNLIADFQNMPVALLMFEVDSSLCASNAAAHEVLGRVPEQGCMIFDLFEGLGRPVSDWLADVAAARLPVSTQLMRLQNHPDTEDAFVQVSLRRLIQDGRVRVAAILQDATALKTLEKQFVQSQKMEAIGQLAGGVAHDFNNLLTAISGHCDLLLTRYSSEDASYPDLVQISQNANRAAGLVGQLLAFSRKQTLQPEYLDIQELVSDMTHLMNRLVGEKVRLSLYHGAAVGTIRADRRQLEQVLLNLVVNARDAMQRQGTIRIETEAVHLTRDLLRDRVTVAAGDYAMIRVVDTGIGIPLDRLQKIFEPFFTTKKQGEGTGLGLSTAYGIVKQSGGFIFVDSTVGQGTTFSIYFPINTAPKDTPKPVPAPSKSTVMRQGEGVILLVEDEAPVRAFAARALRLRGYTVLEAACGEDALEILTDADLRIDLIVSDVIMPGLDGPAWVRQALGQRPQTPIIFVSGYAEDVMTEQQARIPNSAFLAKPFSLTDLTSAVHRQLASKLN